MDLEKIGKFIAECRKAKNLTQEELASKIYVTDRAISKWERGKGMPDSSIMLSLCKELDINVNELLSGEHIVDENYKHKSEKNLFEISAKEQELNKKLMLSEYVIGYFASVFFITLLLIVSFVKMSTALRITLYVLAFIILIIGITFAIKIETETGYYECKHCKHKFIPKYISMFFAPHIGTTRYLKCPKCNKRGWAHKHIK